MMPPYNAVMLLAAVVASLAARGPTSTSDVAALTAKYVPWRGGATFERLRAYGGGGELAAFGLRGTFVRRMTLNGSWSDVGMMGPARTGDVVNSVAGWAVGASGQLTADSPQEAAAIRDLTRLRFAAAVLGARGVSTGKNSMLLLSY